MISDLHLQNQMPPNNKRNNHNLRTQQQVSVSQTWTSPLPPPEVLSAYLAADPKLMDIVVEQITKEASHRHDIDYKLVINNLKQIEIQESLAKSNARERLLNQIFGFLLSFFLIATTFYLAIHGQSWPALGSFGFAIAYIFWGKLAKNK